MARKKLKRKLGRQVLAGKITVDEARSRLGRRLSQQTANKAWSTWPESVSLPRPAVIDENYVLEAVRAKIPVPRPAVTKNRKPPRPALPAPWREILDAPIADPHQWPGAYQPAPPQVVVKQASPRDQAIAAEFRRLASRADDPARRAYYEDQAARITGPALI